MKIDSSTIDTVHSSRFLLRLAVCQSATKWVRSLDWLNAFSAICRLFDRVSSRFYFIFFNQNNQHGQDVRIELVAFKICLFFDKILCENDNKTTKSKMRLPAMDTLRKVAFYTAVAGISGCVYLQIKATSSIGQSPYFRAAFKTLRADPSKIHIDRFRNIRAVFGN